MMKFNADAIVKALKCCNVPSGRACSECPYHDVGEECRTQRNKDAAEFIVRLVKENRNLTVDLKDAEEEYERVYERAEADIRGNTADSGTSCHWCIAGHRADAVKEMLDRAIDRAVLKTYDDDTERLSVSTWELRAIAKEMLEENNV